MQSQMPPLFALNRAYYAMEAMDLAQRAGQGQNHWSRTYPEAPLETVQGQPWIGIRLPRRPLAIVAALVMIGGSAMVGWMA